MLIRSKTCGDFWIRTLLSVFFRGRTTHCQRSDSQKAEPTRDSVTMGVISSPLKKPRLHPADLFGNASIKSGYLDEVLKGSVDDRIGNFEIIDKKKVIPVPYTYHNRLFNWNDIGLDQIKETAKYLKNNPNTRRAQAITWMPTKDLQSNESPCLQRIYMRNRDGYLDFHTEWRSNDCFKALGANTYAMVELMKEVSEDIGLLCGRYVYFGNSLHIYARDWGFPPVIGEPSIANLLSRLSKRGQIPEPFINPTRSILEENSHTDLSLRISNTHDKHGKFYPDALDTRKE